MNVTSAPPRPVTPPSAPLQGGTVKGTLDGYGSRPIQERWTLEGGDKFESTQQMIDKLGVPQAPVRAVYNFHRQSELSKTTGDLLKDYVPKAVIGGAIGGAICAGGLMFVGGILDALTLGMLFDSSLGGVGFLAGGAAVGAGFGAFASVVEAIQGPGDYKEFGEVVQGTITAQAKPDGTHLVFHPWNKLENEVDLQAHAQAPVESSNAAEEGTWWATYGVSNTPIG